MRAPRHEKDWGMAVVHGQGGQSIPNGGTGMKVSKQRGSDVFRRPLSGEGQWEPKCGGSEITG